MSLIYLTRFRFYQQTLTMFVVVVVMLCQEILGAPVRSFEDVEYWIGTGDQQAVLVLDWDGLSDTDQALVWGYRFNSTETAPTGFTMFHAIVTAEPRLFAKIGQTTNYGTPLYGIGYDTNNDQTFTLTDKTKFNMAGFSITSPADGANSTNPTDNYAEGWFEDGFWSYATAIQNPLDTTTSGSWKTSQTGLSDNTVLHESWHSLIFDTNFSFDRIPTNLTAAEPPVLLGDFNQDSRIDGQDLILLRGNYGTTSNATKKNGDMNADGRVDADDLAAWLPLYGTTSAGQASSLFTNSLFDSRLNGLSQTNSTISISHEAYPVPEPKTLTMVLTMMLLLLTFSLLKQEAFFQLPTRN